MFKLFCTFMFFLLLTSKVHSDPPTIRQTTNGPIEGIEETGVFGKKFYAFKGVPYAEVPITGIDPYTGATVDRRFKPTSILTRKWTEPLKVHQFGENCIASSYLMGQDGGYSENCLFLNIYVPAGGVDEKTVLVWIHGGSFLEGSGREVAYGPDFLVDLDNIVITMNYRLGIFGFMNLGFGDYTGNMGLKDQQLALKWIFQNIENFGGNKDEILLFGESAGGASVSYHMLNEKSRKYFQRAMSLSSTALNYYSLYEPNHLERVQNCTNIQDKNKLIEYLRKGDAGTIAECGQMMKMEPIRFESPWVPTIENPKTRGAFITKSPEEIYKSEKAPIMDTLFTFNSQEYLLFNLDLTRKFNPILDGNWNESLFLLAFRGLDKETYPEVYRYSFDLLKRSYLKDVTNNKAIMRGNINLLSDMNFVYPILKTVQYQVIANNKYKAKNTFIFRFNVTGSMNVFKNSMVLDAEGASHADEICYIFRCHIMNSVYKKKLRSKSTSNIEYKTIKRLTKMITNFARTGDPSIDGDTFKSSKSPNKLFCLDIGGNESKLHADIMEQTRFYQWKKIEDFYKNFRSNDSLTEFTKNFKMNSIWKNP
ncbi:cholinesterase 2-like [Contarinia nasturtii]|uniref:cholinesterase 2-like n=1 Tax=Contarinia nasturtii TaxID=265458 RepID=UPI0012D3BF16|nr:cholinesterase 2-like [Contarinia nasturtii]